MEQDAEVRNGEALSYTTEFRLYDPRVGRWLSVDPIIKTYESPYAAFANNPIYYVDPSGLNPSGDPKIKDGGKTTSATKKGKTEAARRQDSRGSKKPQSGSQGSVAGQLEPASTNTTGTQNIPPSSDPTVTPEPEEEDITVPGQIIVEEPVASQQQNLEELVLKNDGVEIAVPEKNLDLEAMTYQAAEYGNRYGDWGNIFMGNVLGAVYNGSVVSTGDALFNPGNFWGEQCSNARVLAIHQATCIYTGTVMEDLGNIWSDPHNYENTVAQGICVFAGARLRPSPARPGLWSKGVAKSPVANAFGHWTKHGAQFPQFMNATQYVKGARSFLHNSPVGTLIKLRKNGDIMKYDPLTNTFGVMEKTGTPKTMFKPTDGVNYFLKQK